MYMNFDFEVEVRIIRLIWLGLFICLRIGLACYSCAIFVFGIILGKKVGDFPLRILYETGWMAGCTCRGS